MHKTSLLTLLLAIFVATAIAQPIGHLTVFSEDGDKFFLVLNGERQNNAGQTNIRVEDLNQPQYSAKIIFEDQSLGEITKNLFISDADGQLMDVTYKVKRDKNTGKPKIGTLPFSAVPVRQGFIAPANTHVVHWGAPVPPQQTTVVVTEPVRGNVTQTTTTTTTTGTGNTVGANVNIGGVNMGVTITDPLLNTNVTTTHTTTTTTTNGGTTRPNPTPTPVGCTNAYAMSSSNFSSALTTVKNQGFDETRLKTAKQIAQSNCLNTSQIAEICNVFGFEETKLSFAKFAYDYCTEPNNYFKINNVFSFSSSSEDLSEYISGRTR